MDKRGKYIAMSIRIGLNRIDGVMVSVLASAVNRGFEPRSGQTKDCTIGMCCFSAKARNQNNVSE